MEKRTTVTETGAVENLHYDEAEDRLIVETVYDPTPVIEENAQIRANGRPVVIGQKGQQLELAMSIPLDHVHALANMGYNLLSPDADERRRALVYIQTHQPKFMTTNKTMFGRRKQIWT